MPDWHVTKRMWVERMLASHCDFELWPNPWPWPLSFKVKFWKRHYSGMGCPIDMERKGCESTECWTHVMTFSFSRTMTLTLNFQRQILELLYPRNGSVVRHETKEIWVCRVLYLICDFELTLTLDFQGQIVKMLYLRNGRADWHGTKGMWVDRMLDSHCDLELWPHPWPWPWIFYANFLNICISWTGGPINMEWKGYEWMGCYTKYVTFKKKLCHRNKRVGWHKTKRMWVDRMLDPSCDFKLWPPPWPWPWIFKVKF